MEGEKVVVRCKKCGRLFLADIVKAWRGDVEKKIVPVYCPLCTSKEPLLEIFAHEVVLMRV